MKNTVRIRDRKKKVGRYRTYQSVSSIATYMAAMAKMMWNQAYWWMLVRRRKV